VQSLPARLKLSLSVVPMRRPTKDSIACAISESAQLVRSAKLPVSSVRKYSKSSFVVSSCRTSKPAGPDECAGSKLLLSAYNAAKSSKKQGLWVVKGLAVLTRGSCRCRAAHQASQRAHQHSSLGITGCRNGLTALRNMPPVRTMLEAGVAYC
jgi:hypothetical protein